MNVIIMDKEIASAINIVSKLIILMTMYIIAIIIIIIIVLVPWPNSLLLYYTGMGIIALRGCTLLIYISNSVLHYWQSNARSYLLK